MRNEKLTERQQARFKQDKAQATEMKYAGDEGVPEGNVTEERKGFQAQLRPDYDFGMDLNKREADDIILESKCQEITSALEGS